MGEARDFDFATLENSIEILARQAFEEISTKHQDNSFCAFALYSDQYAMTVCTAVNTVGHLKKNIEKYPNEETFQKFSPVEWRFERKTHVQWGPIFPRSSDNTSLVGSTMKRGCLGSKKIWQRRVSQCLKSYVRRIFFAPHGPDFVLMFTVSNEDPDVAMAKKHISRLNSEPLSTKFNQWVDSWG